MFPLVVPNKFEKDNFSGIKRELKEEGYCVIKNLADSEEVSEIKKLFRQDLEQITPYFDNFWQLPLEDQPTDNSLGLTGLNGIVQGEACWRVRTNSDIQEIFKAILDTPKLVCSMDSIGFSNDIDSSEPPRNWLHIDQISGIKGSNLDSYQAILYCTDVSGESATTVVVPQSHKSWSILSSDVMAKRHFHIISPNHHLSPRLNNEAIRLKLSSGDLLIWNSKLVHQGWQGKHRLCFMVSYGRKSDRFYEEYHRKLLIYLYGYRTTHWSQYGEFNGCKTSAARAHLKFLKPKYQIEPPEDYYKMNIFEQHSHSLDINKIESFIPPERLKLL